MAINQKLEDMAKEILMENDMLKLPVNLTTIADNYNIDVYSTSLPAGISGAIKYNDNNKRFEILIENTENENRQRFTLAHELAHYFLEKHILEQSLEINFDVLYRRDKNREEKDVEYLAGAILMEREILERLFKINPSISVLAKTFKVSESAMTVRLNVLGLK